MTPIILAALIITLLAWRFTAVGSAADDRDTLTQHQADLSRFRGGDINTHGEEIT